MMNGYRQDKDETPDGFVDLDEWKEYFRCVGARQSLMCGFGDYTTAAADEHVVLPRLGMWNVLQVLPVLCIATCMT